MNYKFKRGNVMYYPIQILASISIHIKEAMCMPRNKTALLGLIVICITILCFTWITRDSLCELRYKDGDSVISATLAYESR